MLHISCLAVENSSCPLDGEILAMLLNQSSLFLLLFQECLKLLFKQDLLINKRLGVSQTHKLTASELPAVFLAFQGAHA